MFKLSILKKMMKESMDGSGLAIGEFESGLVYIQGNWWVIYYNSIGVIPKEVMGMLISFVGQLPGKGNAIRNYGGSESQYELINKEMLDDVQKSAINSYEFTKVIMDGRKHRRMIQCQENKDMKLVDERVIKLINKINDDGVIYGPESEEGEKYIVWRGTNCLFAAAAEEMLAENELIKGFMSMISEIVPL